MKEYIQCEQLGKEFQNQTIFQDLDLTIQQGEIVSLVGPSGAGKSTLLRCLAGFEELTKGIISIDHQDVTRINAKQRPVVMMFQQPLLFPHLTIMENITYGLRVQRIKKKERWKLGATLLKKIELSQYSDSYPYQLSGGQQQRVALTRAILTKPKLLLLDEPFSSLDPELRQSIREWVYNFLKEKGITAIFVTHDQEEAMMMGDRVAVIQNHTIQQMATPFDIYYKPKNRVVAEFFSSGLVLNDQTFIPIDKLHVISFDDKGQKYGENRWEGVIRNRFIKHGQVFDKVELIHFGKMITLIANQELRVHEKVCVLADHGDVISF